MERNNSFIPLSEAQTERLRINLRLPFKLEEEIGLNVRRIQTLLQIGGIKCLKIKNDESLERSKSNMTVVGIGGRGEALAGIARSQDIPLSKLCLTGSNETDCKQAKWLHAEICLNTEEIKTKLLNNAKDVRKSGNWVRFIDKILKSNILKAGSQHLLGDLTTLDVIDSCTHYAAVLYFYFNWPVFLGGPRSREGLTIIIALSAFRNLVFLPATLGGFEQPMFGRRYSLFSGFEPDRALILSGLMACSTLARKIKD